MKHGKYGRYREKINAYIVFVGKIEGRCRLKDGLDVWKILKNS
jgi:hypothetical protein